MTLHFLICVSSGSAHLDFVVNPSQAFMHEKARKAVL